MQYPSQHWPQNAAPLGSGVGGQSNSGGGPHPPPPYSHHGHGGAPPPPPLHQQGGWGHHPQQQAPPPPAHHSAHQGTTSQQLPPPSAPTMVPLQPSPPGGIFRERSNNGSASDGKHPLEMTNGYPPPPPPHVYDGHPPPPHGYSHGPPQGYGYSPHSAQGGQQPPPTGYYTSQQPSGYYGSQHHHPHHGHPGPAPPPPDHSQWGHHPSHGPVPPPGPPPNSSSHWEQQQHGSQSRRSENPHSASEAYYSSHPSSGYSRHNPPPSEVGPPTSHSNAGRAPYIPSRGGEATLPSQQSHVKSSGVHHGSQHPQALESSKKRKAPLSSLSGADSAMTLPHQEAIMPPRHHPLGPPLPPTTPLQPPSTPHGYPPSHHHHLSQQQHRDGGGPPTPRQPNPQNIPTSVHSTPSTARTPNTHNAPMMGAAATTTSSQSSVPPPHHHHTSSSLPLASHLSTPGALSTSTTSYTDDEKGRGSYKCGRCGVPKKGHVCPYQPKVKRRPEDAIPEMKCVSTQVEMDEFMTLRRLNIEIQGYPESYAAEPMDMVGAEVGHHPVPLRPSLPQNGGGMGSVHPGYPMAGGEPVARMAPHCTEQLSGPPPLLHQAGPPPPSSFGGLFSPANSSSHHSGPQSSLPSLTSMSSQPSGSSFPQYAPQDPYPYLSTHHAAPREKFSVDQIGNQATYQYLPLDSSNIVSCVARDESAELQIKEAEISTPPLHTIDEPDGSELNSVEISNGETLSMKEKESTNTFADDKTTPPKSDEAKSENNGESCKEDVALTDQIINTEGFLELDSTTALPVKCEEVNITPTDDNAACGSDLDKKDQSSVVMTINTAADTSAPSELIESTPGESNGHGEKAVPPPSDDTLKQPNNDSLKQDDLSADVNTNTEDEVIQSTSESVNVECEDDCGVDAKIHMKRDAEDSTPGTETPPKK